MKRIILCLILVLTLVIPEMLCLAESPYAGYTYDRDNAPVPAPITHYPIKSVTGQMLGINDFSNPQDLFVDQNHNIFLADTDNNRILKINEQFELIKEYKEFRYQDEVTTLQKPNGIFVDKDGRLYIADTEQNRVLIAEEDGTVTRILSNPQTSLLNNDFVFRPLKVVADSSGNVYVLAYGVYQGMLLFDASGEFHGFYGANRVETTLEVIVERLWRKILSKKQIESSKRFVPSEYTGIDIDDEDFIFACDRGNSNQIKQLNPQGSNVLIAANTQKQYGDFAQEIVQNAPVKTAFQDIDIDESGFINALDFTRGRVFRYDQECNLVGVFGCIGSQEGSFDRVSAVESLGDLVLVLDSAKALFTVFQKGEYARLIEEAVSYYNDGLYAQALEPWQEVLKRNCNFELAHDGLGKAYLKLGDYSQAMKSFRLAGNNEGYSEAFTAARNVFIRQHFTALALGAVLAVLVLTALVKTVARKRKERMR